MSHSPAVSAEGEPEEELVNLACKASEAAANEPARVAGAAPAPTMIGPAERTEVAVMKLSSSPSVPTLIESPPVPANAVVTLTIAFEITKSAGVSPRATVTVSVEPLPSSTSVKRTFHLWVKPWAAVLGLKEHSCERFRELRLYLPCLKSPKLLIIN